MSIIEPTSDLFHDINKSNNMFTKEQMRDLLEIAFNYMYKVIHDMRLARAELSKFDIKKGPDEKIHRGLTDSISYYLASSS